jgi:hypothetical protein
MAELEGGTVRPMHRPFAPSSCLPWLVVAACQPGSSSNPPIDGANEQPPIEPAAPVVEPEPDPAHTLEAIESAVLDGDRSVRFTVVATGALEVKMQGLLMVSADRVSLQSRGSFGDQVVELTMTADGERMRGGGPGPKFDLPEAPALREALLIGLVRMGVLHNLAVMLGGRPPDHADGGVRQWVVADDPRLAVARGMEAPAEISSENVVSFDLTVADQPSGSASVWFDARSGLPVGRQQIVDFPDGRMQVSETYMWGQ